MNQTTTKTSKVCFGYTNKSLNNTYLPFFDYDCIDLKKVKKELLLLQKKYFLSNIYIFKSKNGFNALSLDKLPYNKLVLLYGDCKKVCNDYLELGMKRNILTLRIGNDKIFYGILSSNNDKWEKSLSHAILLNMFFKTQINIDKSFDNNLYLRLKVYRSEKHGFLKVKEL